MWKRTSNRHIWQSDELPTLARPNFRFNFSFLEIRHRWNSNIRTTIFPHFHPPVHTPPSSRSLPTFIWNFNKILIIKKNNIALFFLLSHLDPSQRSNFFLLFYTHTHTHISNRNVAIIIIDVYVDFSHAKTRSQGFTIWQHYVKLCSRLFRR